MTITIIIAFSVLLLLAYIFDLTASLTRIPSVVLLIIMGWLVRKFLFYSDIKLPDFSPVLPILGTIGLVLIVLEGSLELELNRTKFKLIRFSFLGAFLTLVLMSLTLGCLFHFIGNHSFKDSLINAVPLCVISSAIAIPSVKHLSIRSKEFITYESSFSDIIGVLIFNFLLFNEQVSAVSFTSFIFQLFLIAIISIGSTIGLSYLLNRIEHRIKFIPIILLIVLIYAVSKYYHLPALVFIMLFGLSIGNLDELRSFRWIKWFKPEQLDVEVKKFHELIGEIAFLVRALFFLLFGFLIETAEVLNPTTLTWAILILLLILIYRGVQLRVSSVPLFPLLFVAPRGLITILLYLSIAPEHNISIVNRSLIIQVILLSAFLMMAGFMFKRHESKL